MQERFCGNGTPTSSETVSYIAMEQGVYTLADGSLVEAGGFQTSAAASYATIKYAQPFAAAPVVVTSIGSFNNTYPLSGKVQSITTSSFNYRMDATGSGATAAPAAESIGFIAWQPSSGTENGLSYEVGVTPDLSTSSIKTIVYGDSFTVVPEFVADLQAFSDSDTSTLRWVTVDMSGADLQIDEQAATGATASTTPKEVVGYILLAPASN
jgi:hypothetical protein